MTESEFITALQSKDGAAFKRLVEYYGGLVYNTALGMLQQVQEAEDVTQEVFVQVYESIQLFKRESKLSTWLYRIAVTKSLDRIKYNKRKKRGGLLLSLFTKEGKIQDVPDFLHPGVVAANKERSVVLFKAISLLPDNQKIAFTLSKVEGLSQNEIAEIMECTIASVEAYLQRAKQNLRKSLEDYYKNDN